MIHAVAQVRATVLLRVHAATIRAIKITWHRHVEASSVESLLVHIEALLLGTDRRGEHVTVGLGRHRRHADDIGVSRSGHLTILDLALSALDRSLEVERIVSRRLESTVSAAAAVKRARHIGRAHCLIELGRARY